MKYSKRGLIIDTCVYDRSIYEEVKSERSGILRVVRGPISEWGKLNRNNRKYSERLWDRTLDSPYLKEQLLYHTLFGEGNHPTDRMEVDFARVAILILDIWKVPESNQIWAEIAILDTPLGRILNTLYDAGSILGYSTRAGGTLHQRKGYIEVDENDYNFITIDAVPYPSVVIARPTEVMEGVSLEVDLPDEVHEKLCSIISESGLENKNVIKDFIYSIKGFNMCREKALLEGAVIQEEPTHQEEVTSESKTLETTLSLLKESSLQINCLRAENQTLSANNESLKAENESLKANLNESLSTITGLVQSSKEMSEDKEILESRNSDTIAVLEKRIRELEDIIEGKDLEILDLVGVREACEVLKQENAGMRSSLKAALFTADNSEKSIVESTNNLKQELEEAYSEIVCLVSESNKKDEEIRELTKVVESLTSDLKKSEKEITEAKKHSKSQPISEELKLENKELSDKIDKLNESLDSANRNLDSVKESCNQYKEDLVSVICSGYNLSPEAIMSRLPVQFTKSDIYCVCESLTCSVNGGVDFESVVIDESVSESSQTADSTHPNPDKEKIKGWLYTNNRRGIVK